MLVSCSEIALLVRGDISVGKIVLMWFILLISFSVSFTYRLAFSLQLTFDFHFALGMTYRCLEFFLKNEKYL